MTTTGAQDTAAGLLSVLTTYRTANPTLLRGVWAARPAQLAEIPLAWVDIGPEVVSHSGAIRQRNFTPTVTLVDAYTDNEQLASRLNINRDGLMDAFSAAVNIVPNQIIGMTSVDPIVVLQEFTDGRPPLQYPALLFTFGEVWLQEGRP